LCLSIAGLSACSFLVDRSADQCRSDGDCARLAGARCDVASRLCVGPETTLDADGGDGSDSNSGGSIPDVSMGVEEGSVDGDGSLLPDVGSSDAGTEALVEGRANGDAGDASSDTCIGPSGCYACPPATDLQYESACTNAICRPFDNKKRLSHLLPEAGLSPLPE
jgi:hypothetical protein